MAEERYEREERRAERNEEARRERGHARTDADYRHARTDTEYRIEDGSLTSTAVTGLAVALLKPDLLPGMAIGVAATMGPRLLPIVGSILRPIFSTVVRAGYATAMATREVAAEASEQFQDMVAEARADYQEPVDGEEGRPQPQRARARA